MAEASVVGQLSDDHQAALRELLAESDRLTEQLDTARLEAKGIHADRVGHDNVDDGIAAADADQAGHIAELTQQRLDDIASAVQRIYAGIYGICDHCGQAIDPARLEARPTANLCVSCAKRKAGRNP